jgi:stearoyl-CoA desaturase (delta-9 desaturase)
LRRWSGVEHLDGASYGIGTRLWKGVELYSPSCLDPATLHKYGHDTPDDWIERHLYTPH